uniref:Thylakoid lumenal kDa protein chloroplastic-like n=1 Tax=Tetraselmis sp. GSL018 TaxID=582737 RepID=A0A061R048_9CHLO
MRRKVPALTDDGARAVKYDNWEKLKMLLGATVASVALVSGGADARMEGVNKPELLPKGAFTTVIDVAGFLTNGEEDRIRQEVDDLYNDTGIKLRVLAQNYPDTPGLAIKDYWGVDEDTVVFVADPNTGNILNFNVGSNVDLMVPRNFWTRLSSKFGNKFFWQEQGEASAVLNAVSAISNCLHEPLGRGQCSTIRGMSDPLERFS